MGFLARLFGRGGQQPRIGLQKQARPLMGRIEHHWFENAGIGLARTLFHRIVVPFEPFDSGLSGVSQPESTRFVVEWIDLGLADPAALDGVRITRKYPPGFEASIYLGAAHNPVDIKELRLTQQGSCFRLSCSAVVDFEHEGVAPKEALRFEALVTYIGEV